MWLTSLRPCAIAAAVLAPVFGGTIGNILAICRTGALIVRSSPTPLQHRRTSV